MLAYFALGFVFTLIMMYGLRKENERRERGERDEKIVGSPGELAAHGRGGTFTSIDEARTAKGDHWSGTCSLRYCAFHCGTR